MVCDLRPRNTDKRASQTAHSIGHVNHVNIAEGVAEEIMMVNKAGRVIMILDSGCRLSVAGAEWHRRMQEECASQGLTWKSRQASERFVFGDGDVVDGGRSNHLPCGHLRQRRTT